VGCSVLFHPDGALFSACTTLDVTKVPIILQSHEETHDFHLSSIIFHQAKPEIPLLSPFLRFFISSFNKIFLFL